MADLKEQCGILIVKALNSVKAEMGLEGDVGTDTLVLETPPNPQMGDVGVPMFPFAKVFRMAPPVIAQKVAEAVKKIDCSGEVGEFFATGPYVNVRLNKEKAIAAILEHITDESQSLGLSDDQGREPLKGRRVMIEFSSPNTNKPLHLGHLRNDALGESISRILKEAGAEVFKVNIINNRGVHICKSMLAYKKFHEPKGETPESLGIKSDRFVGDCYVEFDKWSKEDATAEAQAQDLLVQWEKGDKEVHELWNTMNQWAIAGITQTYKRTGVSFDKLYYESETYLKGKEEILKGLESGIFYREEDGSVWVDLTSEGLDQKLLLRADGTSVYMTQDIGTAEQRFADYPIDKMIYVVGNEQNYHFQVLSILLDKLGFEWGKSLVHFSYGMVELPEGKMKSREGTVVDADDLMGEMIETAKETSGDLGKLDGLTQAEADDIARIVGLGALKYFILKVDARKNMTFNPKESIDFNGNTGPFIQYTYARIRSVLRKATEAGIAIPEQLHAGIELSTKEEGLIQMLADFAGVVKQAGEDYSPSLIANYCYDLVKEYNQFYHDYSILREENPDVRAFRLSLSREVSKIVRLGLGLLGIEVPERM